jgi:hypothetical protein
MPDRCKGRDRAQSRRPEWEVFGRQQVHGATGPVRPDQASLFPQAPTDLRLRNIKRAYPDEQFRGGKDLGMRPAHGPNDIGRAAVPGGRGKPVPLQPSGANLCPRKGMGRWPDAHPCSVPSTRSGHNG